MKAARFGFFLARARTNMQPNKWVIFTYDSANPPRFGHSPRPYASQPPSGHRGTGLKKRLKATIKVDVSRPEIYRRNEAKATKGVRTQQLQCFMLRAETWTL